VALTYSRCGHAPRDATRDARDARDATRATCATRRDARYDQGVYALAQNYGSLVARLVLGPLEESARVLFSKLGTTLAAAEVKAATATDADAAGEALAEMVHARSRLALTLSVLLKSVGYLGLLFVAFGTSHTTTLLALLPGAKWAGARGASATLSWYCGYVLTLALNGALEAFAHAVATTAQVSSASRL
jgi:oligosaccharide translocation protein RFT1